MPKLTIDNREIEVPAGPQVIAAAEQLGIMIPRFCYHPALGAVGACRVCAVKFEEGPVKGIEMSCMVDARDGMRVSTTDPEAVDFRRQVIEWLMLNHPHDCPVCDEGGHCLLQDMTVSGGHGIRRYEGSKRTHMDQDLGPLVQHEMNRCIQCYRCVRFYREYAGYHDLGVMGIGSRVYFGRMESGTLQSPFSGNLIDICPTGVFTDKPSRFIGRRWDFERRPSICIHCSLGCHVTTSVHLREVVRQEARVNPTINGHFICDRGRYGFDYAGHPDRPRMARLHGRNGAPHEALAAARESLAGVSDRHGAGALAVMGGTRGSLETLLALKHLCRKGGWADPVFWLDGRQTRVMKAVAELYRPETAADPMDLATADMILAIGVDPLNEAPMLAPAMRLAARNGGRIFMAHPGPLSLPFAARHLMGSPGAFDRLLSAGVNLLKGPKGEEGLLETTAATAWPDPGAAVEMLRNLQQSKRPVILVGSDLAGVGTVVLAATLARVAAPRQAKVLNVLPGANAMAAALMDESGQAFTDVLTRMETGDVKALVLAECDPLWDFPDRRRLEAAMRSLETLVVLDCVDTAAARLAHILIPTQTVFESGGVYVNAAGRTQRAGTLFTGGLPIRRTGNGGHPPRLFGRDIPGADIPPAWQALWRMAEPDSRLEPEAVLESICLGQPDLLTQQDSGRFPADRIKPAGESREAEADESAEWETGPDAFRLLLADEIFGVEILSSRSPCLQRMEPEPRLWMSATDARELGFNDGGWVQIQSNGATMAVRLTVSGRMTPGFLSLPRLRGSGWQIFDRRSPVLAKRNISRREKGNE